MGSVTESRPLGRPVKFGLSLEIMAIFGGKPSHVDVDSTSDRRQGNVAWNADKSEAEKLVKRIPRARAILHRE